MFSKKSTKNNLKTYTAHCLQGVLYCDAPYGHGVADWDAAAPTEDALRDLIRGFLFLKGTQQLVSVVLWTNPFQLGIVKKVLEEQSFKHIQILTWYKQSFNMVTAPPCIFLPTTEVAVIAFHGNVNVASQYLNMPPDPLERHNILIGPKMGKRAVDNEGKDVNLCEKPDYVAEWILRKLTKPGDNVIIAGFGAGGDLRGALNAGCNVFAIEQDERQFNATKRMMPLFVPKPDLSMVVSREEVSFGHECLLSLGPYRNHVDGTTFDCRACGKELPGSGNLCSNCNIQFCFSCSDEATKLCFVCRQDALELAKAKKEEAESRANSGPATEPVSDANVSGN